MSEWREPKPETNVRRDQTTRLKAGLHTIENPFGVPPSRGHRSGSRHSSRTPFRRIVCLALLSASLAHGADGACHALLVGGMPGAPVYARRYRDWLTRFHAHLVGAGAPAANIRVLTGDKDFRTPIVNGPATADSVRTALLAMSDAMKAGDQFVLILVGHGSVADMSPTVILPGPDLTSRRLADALDALPATRQIVLNLTASAGDALKDLARVGRVNVAATSAGEANEPVFAEFFLRGLESKRADGEGAPKDGSITVLEAYNWASAQTAWWIVRQKLANGAWQVEGKESVALFKKLCEGPANEAATRQLAGGSRPDVDDAVHALRPEGGKIDDFWRSRRLVTEHATLEDCGEETGALALQAKGYVPLDGKKDGEPGHLARRVVLGRAVQLSPKP